MCGAEPKYFPPTDFAPLIGPIRRYLIRRRDMETYRRLLRYLRGIAEGSVYPPILVQAAAEMVKECSSGDALACLATGEGGARPLRHSLPVAAAACTKRGGYALPSAMQRR